MEVFRELPSSAELSAFCKQDASSRQFSDELRSILEVSALTGLYWHRWDELRTLLLFRLKQVLQDFYKSHMHVAAVGPPRPLVTGESYQELEDRLTSGLEAFTDGAPFTIQRFCEVLLNPRDRYPNLDKVALAFEKLLLVTSTIPPSTRPYPVPDQQPAKRDTLDSGADIVISEAKDVVPIAADAHMVDSDSTEPKERSMDAEETAEESIAAETTAEQGSRENASEVKDEEPGVAVEPPPDTVKVGDTESISTSNSELHSEKITGHTKQFSTNITQLDSENSE